MNENEDIKGALVSGTLSAKIEIYFKSKIGAEITFLDQHDINPQTQQAILDDLWRKLTYTDKDITASLEQINEIRDKIPLKEIEDFASAHADGVFLILLQEYEKIARVAELSESLQGIEVKIDGKPVEVNVPKDEADQAARKIIGEDMELQQQDIRLAALRQELQYEGAEEEDLERAASETRYANFLAQSMALSGATNEELLLVVPQGLPPIKPEQIEKLLQRTRKELEAGGGFVQAKDMCEQVAPDTYDEYPPGREKPKASGNKPQTKRKGSSIVRLHQNIISALSGPLIMAKQAKADAYPDGIEVKDNKNVPAPPGSYTLINAIEKANREIELEARKNNTKPTKLTANRVYQCLHGLEVLANDYGQPVTSPQGVEYFKYQTSFRKLAEICYNNPNPNADLIRQTVAALEVLKNNYTTICEKRVRNVKVTKPDGTKETEQRYYTYGRLVQLINLPTVTFRNNPDGTINHDIGIATVDIQIHSVLRTGKSQNTPVIRNGRPEYLLTPHQHFIPYDVFQDSLRYFQSKDGSGQRFFNMILSKKHKLEDDLLAQVFDYKGKIEQAAMKARTKLENRWAKSPAADVPEPLEAEEQLKEEAAKAEAKARRSISKNKARDRETLKLWFSQAVELDIIQPDPLRHISKTQPGFYVWEWERKPTKQNDMIEE